MASRKTLLAGSALSVALLGTGPTHADALTETLAAVVKAADENGDGQLSRAELKAFLRQSATGGRAKIPRAQHGSADGLSLASRFDTIDTDHDGGVSVAEIDAFIDQRFRAADIDGDGTLTVTEAASAMPQLARYFSEIDAAGQGRISLPQARDFTAAQLRQCLLSK